MRRIVVRQPRLRRAALTPFLWHRVAQANAANAITYIGLKLAGTRGAIASVVSFILPSFLMMIGLTIAHDRLHHLPDVQRVFQGLNAAVVGLIAATAARLGKEAMQRQWHLELGVATAFVLIFMGASVAEVVLLAGITGIFIQSFRVRGHTAAAAVAQAETVRRPTATATAARQSAAETTPDEQSYRDHTITRIAKARTAPAQKSTVKPLRGDTNRRGATHPTSAGLGDSLIALPFLGKLAASWELLMVFLRVGAVPLGEAL
jgi:chromate transporter